MNHIPLNHISSSPPAEQHLPFQVYATSPPSTDSPQSGLINPVVVHQHFYPQNSENTTLLVRQLLELNLILTRGMSQLEAENEQLKQKLSLSVTQNALLEQQIAKTQGCKNDVFQDFFLD